MLVRESPSHFSIYLLHQQIDHRHFEDFFFFFGFSVASSSSAATSECFLFLSFFLDFFSSFASSSSSASTPFSTTSAVLPAFLFSPKNRPSSLSYPMTSSMTSLFFLGLVPEAKYFSLSSICSFRLSPNLLVGASL